MSKGFILTTDELFGSYCYIEQKRYGVPNEKFLYKIIGKFTSNAWSNVPVDANDKEPHIFNHSEEVVNVVCCGVCEDKIERYKLSDVEIISNKDQQLADLEAKLAESEKERELDNSFWKQECDGLQKALAEKTLTIEQINKAFIGNRSLWKGKYERANQDKISFCIEQLEKVKEFVSRQLFITTKDCSDLDEAEAKGCNELREETIKEIDNQINVLRNNKDGIH